MLGTYNGHTQEDCVELMIPHEDSEYTSHTIDPLQESPLDKLNLKEKFKPLEYLTCRVCTTDITLWACYFRDSNIPYCGYCYDFILGIEEDEDE